MLECAGTAASSRRSGVFEQLALDPLVSPAAVLGGELLDQHDDLALTGGRPVRLG
jgi:hypothetical protein